MTDKSAIEQLAEIAAISSVRVTQLVGRLAYDGTISPLAARHLVREIMDIAPTKAEWIARQVTARAVTYRIGRKIRRPSSRSKRWI